MKVDVIIPTLCPGREFVSLLERLEEQSVELNRIIVMNTEKEGAPMPWDEPGFFSRHPKVTVKSVKKEGFDHGGTRNAGVSLSDAEIFICMTQDALPADRELVRCLTGALGQGERIAAAYARQLPKADCGRIERFTRQFNYPETSSVKGQADLARLGIKTYFCSNVCAAYRRDVFRRLGGFCCPTIFNEDMIYAAGAVKAGYEIAYAADARVFHSHNYTGRQQFARNFDLGVSHAQYPGIFSDVPPEGEGMRLVKRTAVNLLRTCPWLLPKLVWQSGAKWLGYRMGLRYDRLPRWLVKRCSFQKGYWK